MSSSSASFRQPGQPPAPPPTRQQAYSSLGEALGSERPGLSPYTQQPPPPPTTSSIPMSSDGRYMYQHQQGMSSYDYSSYPHNSYDASQFPQNHSRQPRSSQSHPSSEHVPYNPPQPHYHAPYGSTPYAVPHSAPPQWNGEAWTQFSQPVAPAPSVPDPPAPPPLNRPEPAAAPALPAPAPVPAPTPAPPSQRIYAASPQPQANAEMRRTAGTPKAADPPPQHKRKPREKEAAAPRHPSPLASTPLDIDFGKLIESYRIIIDTTTALTADPATVQGRPPSLEALQRISQSAALGLRLLGSTVGTDSPGTAPSAESPVANSGNVEEGDAAAKRQKAEAPVPEGQTCLGCSATSTPEWRRGPLGPRTLCNACGLVYAKLIKKRKRDAARRAANTQDANDGAPADDASSGDEDESASQEFRMEDEHVGRG
ncbi:hypothetical protein EDB87DRAFT_1586823 [Lactarius vividus]|nr:hypothetical protein EDB87DRAFT_1586823 [Lactarius vividus]